MTWPQVVLILGTTFGILLTILRLLPSRDKTLELLTRRLDAAEHHMHALEERQDTQIRQLSKDMTELKIKIDDLTKTLITYLTDRRHS